MIGAHVSACVARPPRQVLDHLGRQVKQLLAEGVRPEHSHAGLARFAARPMHPSVLPSLVNEAMNTRGTPQPGGKHRAWTNPADIYAAYAEEL